MSARTAGRPSRRLNRSISGDQPTVPPQDGIGRDNRGHLHESPATALRADVRQAPPFLVCQPQSTVPQLRLKDSVLLAQIPYCLRLFALEPTQERRDDCCAEITTQSMSPSTEYSDTTRVAPTHRRSSRVLKNEGSVPGSLLLMVMRSSR